MEKITFGECLKQGFEKLEWLKCKETDFINFIDDFSTESAQKFINGYFEKRKKGDSLKGIYVNDSLNAKGVHSVSVFLLGMYLYKRLKIDNFLDNKIENCNLKEKLENCDFEFFWFLIALHHDLNSAIEQKLKLSNCNNHYDRNIIDTINKKIGGSVNNNVFENKIPFTYCEDLVQKYFGYIVRNKKRLDHGITAGFLAYSDLYDNLNKKLNGREEKTEGNMLFEKNDYIAYAIVADAIMVHNIWFAYKEDDIKKYKENELDYFVYNKENKEKDHRLSIKNNPLPFYLALIDTIEPFKYFDKCLNKKCIANNITFEVSENQIMISALNYLNIEKWYNDKIGELQYWLKVKCECKNNKIVITIL